MFLKYQCTLEPLYSDTILSIAHLIYSASAQCPEAKLKENKKLHFLRYINMLSVTTNVEELKRFELILEMQSRKVNTSVL